MSDKIGVTLSSKSLAVNAGESVQVVATIQNRSQIVDQFTMALDGLPPTWYDFSVSSVSLFPGDKDEVRITIHPPKSTETKAGTYPFTVKAVSSTETQEFTGVEASLQVRTFAELSVDMSPMRVVGTSGTYTITLNNQGNAEITRDFEASDPEEALAYTFMPKVVTVPAGGSATVQLSARLKKKPEVEGEGEKEYPFQVVIKPAGEDKFSPEAKTLNGQLVYAYKKRARPKMPRWLIILLAVLAAVIIGLLLFHSCAISPPEITSFKYVPAEEYGEQGYMLVWAAKGATEGDINGEPLEEAQLDNGTMLADPGTAIRYVLTMSNEAGSVNATVIIPPFIEVFHAAWLGGDFNVTWSVKGSHDLYLNNESADPNGTMTVHPGETTTYTLLATNEGGQASQNITLTPPSVTVTSPNGGEKWPIGSQYDASWAGTNPRIDGTEVTPAIHHVNLEYSTNGGRTWRSIATNEPNDGSFTWTIPNTPSTTCLMRATIYSSEGKVLGQDISDSYFSIVAEGGVQLLRPAEGERVSSGIGFDIAWTSSGSGIDHVGLAYSIGGASWQTIVSDYSNTGSYRWQIPRIAKDSPCDMRVTIYDAAGNELASDTNAFTLLPPPTVRLTYPNGGEYLWGQCNITWTTTGTGIHHVSLQYSTDGGKTWRLIDSYQANDGVYLWTIPCVNSVDCLVRVTIYDSGGIALGSDVSDRSFGIYCLYLRPT